MNHNLRNNRVSSVAFTALFVVTLLIPSRADAQIRVGAAFGLDTEIGITAGYYMPLNVSAVEGLSVGVDGVFYLPETTTVSGQDYTSNFFEVNANGHYPFTDVSSGSLYALAGLQYARASVDTPFGDASSSDVGLNLGAGLDFGKFFAEAKFGLGGFEQLVLSAGLSF